MRTIIQVPTPSAPALASTPATQAIVAHYKELVSEYARRTAQRNATTRRMEGMPTTPERASFQVSLGEIDSRLTSVGQEIASTQAQLIAASQQPVNPRPSISVPPDYYARQNGKFSSDQLFGIVMVFFVVVVMPISITISRSIWRRGSNKPPRGWDDTAAKIARIEAAVDTIAVEVERVSENQRFVSKIIAERDQAGQANGAAPLALGAGAAPAQPIAAAERVDARTSFKSS